MIPLDDPISSGTAAKLLNMTPALFCWYVKKGVTPRPTKIGRYNFFERSEIQAWVKPESGAGWQKGRKRKPACH